MSKLEVSSTKSVAQDELQNECLSCPICFDVFKEPKILSCLHRFCEGCLQNYMTSLKKEEIAANKGFKCPICRGVTKPPDKKIHYSQWASALKTDFYLINVIRFVESNAKFMVSETLPVAQQTPCAHKDECVKKYCVDCCKPICSKCKNVFHKSCENILPLATAAADRKALVDIMSKKIMTKLDKIDNIEATRKKFLEVLEDERMRAERLIEERKEEIQKVLQDQEEKLLAQLHQQFEIFHEEVAARVLQFNDKIMGCREGLHELSMKVENASDYELVTDDSIFHDCDAFLCDDVDITAYEKFVSGLSQMKIAILETEPSVVEIGICGVQLLNPGSDASPTLIDVSTNHITAAQPLGSIEFATTSPKDLILSGASNKFSMDEVSESSEDSDSSTDAKTQEKFGLYKTDELRVRSALEELKIL